MTSEEERAKAIACYRKLWQGLARTEVGEGGSVRAVKEIKKSQLREAGVDYLQELSCMAPPSKVCLTCFVEDVYV